MNDVSKFLKVANRQDFRKALNLSDQSLTRAISENVMPAGWYAGARDFCDGLGVELPEHLFRWHDRMDRLPITNEAEA
jgi:hypothetical protein